MKTARVVVAAFFLALAVVIFPSAAWSSETPSASPETTEQAGDPSPAPSSTAPVEGPTETVTVTVAPEPSQTPPAPGQGTGVYVDPSTGSVRVNENTGVALGVAVWLFGVVAGIATANGVLP